MVNVGPREKSNMWVIVAGSRDITDFEVVKTAIEESGMNITKVVSGKARGIDTLGEKWAKLNDVPVEECPADWDRYGKSAGYVRNDEMAQIADGLIAIWDGKSKGTKHMIDLAHKEGVEVFVWTP